MNALVYPLFLLGGIAASIVVWSRLAKRDTRLLIIYVAGLTSAFLGAKIIYIMAEGWLHFGAPDMWLQLATGKSILGALLGGYAGVEIAKKITAYKKVTGDLFALIAPIGILIGRTGCLFHGCCLGEICQQSWFTMRDRAGVDRWPAVPTEMLFNLGAVLCFWILRRRHLAAGQHFHIYLIAYGTFRFAHEFFRATPRVAGVFSGYQIAAAAVAILGVTGFILRAKRGARFVAD